MKKILLLAIILCASPAWAVKATIARVAGCQGTSGATCSSGTVTGVEVGDWAYAFASRDALTAPTLPSGWTQIATASASTSSFRSACQVLTSTSLTVGAWTNANKVVIEVYRGANASYPQACTTAVGFKTAAGTSGTTSTITYTGGTLTVTDGSSWMIGASGSSAHTCTPATLSAVQTVTGPVALLNDSNGGVSSFTTVTCTGTTGNWKSDTLELEAATVNATCSNTDQSGTTFGLIGCWVTVSSGDSGIVACRYGSTTANVTTVNDNGGTNTWTAGASSTVNADIGTMKSYTLANGTAESNAFVYCKYTTAISFISIVVDKGTGYASGIDVAAVATNCTSSCSQTSITSSAFTTGQASENIYACGTWNFSTAETWSLGAIGGTTATGLITSSGTNGDLACENLTVSVIQTAQTAALGIAATGQLNDSYMHVVSFKAPSAGGVATMPVAVY